MNASANSFWNIAPFNAMFFISFLFFVAILVAASILLRKKSEKTRRVVIAVAMIVAFVSFWIYKIALSLDTDYAKICEAAGTGTGKFNWFSELPFQLCNINLIMVPIAVLTKKRPLLSFCFFTAPLGAMLALLMPAIGFEGYSILLPRMLGYYFTHYMVIIGGLSVVTFGIYRPRLRDIPGSLLAIIGVSFFSFCISMLFRVTKLDLHANYFYSVETEGNAILDIFHKIVPVPYLYLLCSVVIIVPYMLIMIGIVALCTRSWKKQEPEEEAK